MIYCFLFRTGPTLPYGSKKSTKPSSFLRCVMSPAHVAIKVSRVRRIAQSRAHNDPLSQRQRNSNSDVSFGHIKRLKTTLNKRKNRLYENDHLLMEYRQSAVRGGGTSFFFCAVIRRGITWKKVWIDFVEWGRGVIVSLRKVMYWTVDGEYGNSEDSTLRYEARQTNYMLISSQNLNFPTHSTYQGGEGM